MPGYRPIPTSITGDAADSARAAAALTKTGDPAGAATLLEEALAASLLVRREMPGWLCGRLAVLYRSLGRLEDEVHLLERYCESQSSDDARARFDARLSKARTLLARRRPKNDSVALASVREAIQRPRRPRPDVAPRHEPVDVDLPEADLERLTTLFALQSKESFDARLGEVLTLCSRDARSRGLALEVLVEGLRIAAGRATSLPESQRTERYSAALVELLALYFRED
ncbi:MAG TPA: hypothetical protein VGP25_10090 [Gemmatimonadaceae bacterium]|jgi:hypothetical protein|nr:hypothetical protein [Gemmatimonadaceae bacterium]